MERTPIEMEKIPKGGWEFDFVRGLLIASGLFFLGSAAIGHYVPKEVTHLTSWARILFGVIGVFAFLVFWITLPKKTKKLILNPLEWPILLILGLAIAGFLLAVMGHNILLELVGGGLFLFALAVATINLPRKIRNMR